MKKPIPFGKYYLLEQVNVGGMAEVFKAKAYGVEGFERLIALKRILPNIAEDKEFIEMFIFEAKIAVQLNHANIAQIYELGKVDDAYFIALEYVHGKDSRALFDRCRSKGESMPIAQACFIIMKMCEGLDYAHNKRDGSGRDMNLVHRDVSPQNVLVSYEGEVKLIDFGIAKAANKASKTQAGILKGKFGYMSPEQVRGLPVDRRSDVFASGIVLYELLTGERLFVGESDFSTLEKVRNVEILPPSTYNRKIPDELERIVLKALAKDVEDRYQNAIDLHDDLQAFVYTAGEFYARKDLAAWMKKGFTKEIEDEAAKLEQYRHIALPAPNMTPPPQLTPNPRTTLPPGSKRPTMSMPAAAPPPPPAAALSASPRMTGRMPSLAPPPLPGQQIVATPSAHLSPKATLAMPAVTPPPEPRLAHASAHGHGSEAPERLEWDDEELETQIYGSPEEEAAAKAAKAAKVNGNGKVNGHGQNDAAHHATVLEPPGALPPPPIGPPGPVGIGSLGPTAGPNARTMSGAAFEPSSLKSSLPPRPVDESRPWGKLDTERHGHSGQTATATAVPTRSTKKPLILGISAGVVIVGGVIAFLLLRNADTTSSTGGAGGSGSLAAGSGSDTPTPSAAPGAGSGDLPAVTPAPTDEAQVKVITDPVKLQAKLDGTPIGETPMNISRLAPGKHTLELFGSNLFAPRTEVFEVAPGESKELNLTLDALPIKAEITTVPSGAKLFLEHDGARDALGEAPQSVTLDPRKSYVLVAERDGYEPSSQPIEITQASFPIALTLTKTPKSGGAVAVRVPRDKPPVDKTPPGDKPPPGNDKPPVDKTPDPVADKNPPGDKPPADKGGMGSLSINSKPWTTIFVDGREVGHTPQKDIQLKPGPHKITLVNNELNIRAQLNVTIKSGEVTKLFKDLRENVPEPNP